MVHEIFLAGSGDSFTAKLAVGHGVDAHDFTGAGR